MEYYYHNFMSVIQPLNEGLLAVVYEHARAWRPFCTQKKVLNYLEDCLTSNFTALNHFAVGGIVSSLSLSELIAVQTFYITATFRYLQKAIDRPTHVQHLPLYDTQDGNQIDKFIKEFFDDTLSSRIIPS